MKRYGYEYLSGMKGDVAKKDEPAPHILKNFYAEIIKQLQDYVQRYTISQVIIAGPAFWKQELQNELKDAGFEILYTKSFSMDISTLIIARKISRY